MLKIDDEAPGVPEWVVTFGDMMSLLLTFFILLYSMSEIKTEESQAMIESMRKQFGHDRSIASMVPGRIQSANSRSQRVASMGRARRADTMNGGDKVKAPVGENPRVTAIRQGAETSIGNRIYYLEGAAEMLDAEENKIAEIAREIQDKPQIVEVRGHTTARPLGDDSPYRNHEDLAYNRAFQVRQRLIRLGIDKRRIRLTVAGANEPLHIGHDPEKLKENARVEVYLVAGTSRSLQGTPQERSDRYSRDGSL